MHVRYLSLALGFLTGMPLPALPSGGYHASVTSQAPDPRYLLPLLSLLTAALVRSVLGRPHKPEHDTRKRATTPTDDPLIWS
jgi:hypothetical protein